MARPELPLDFGIPDAIDADATEETHSNEWLGEVCLNGPRKLYSLAEQIVFPNARNFKLQIELETHSPGDETGDEASPGMLKITYLYLDQNGEGDRITPLSIAGESLTPEALSGVPFQLPSAPGSLPGFSLRAFCHGFLIIIFHTRSVSCPLFQTSNL